MKRIGIIILVYIIVSGNAYSAEAEFSDIAGHWAENTIIKWKDSGLINGYPNGTFKPDDPITRAEFAKVMATAFELTDVQSYEELDQERFWDILRPEEYTDIYKNEWYYPYIERTAKFIPTYPLPTNYESNMPYRNNERENGNKFLPDCYAIRMHIAEALANVKIEKENITIDELPISYVYEQVKNVFKDAEYQSLYAIHGFVPRNLERMLRYTWIAYRLGIVEGDTDGYFNPYGYMTRAELITALDRMMSNEASE